MPVEVECKIRVKRHEPVRERMQAVGGRFLSRVFEVNRILDRDEGSLRTAGCGLRIRATIVLEGPAKPATVTFKGPREPGPYKRRQELEVAISDAERMGDLLAALGYHEVLLYEKNRESWQLGDCRVELDELPHLGRFVEIEGPDEAAVAAAAATLGFAEASLVPDSYVALVATWGKGLAERAYRRSSTGATSIQLCFEHSSPAAADDSGSA